MNNTKDEIHLTERVLSAHKRKYKKTLRMSLFLLILGVIIFSIGFLTVDQYIPENPLYQFWVIISGLWIILNFGVFVIGLLERSTYKQLYEVLLKGFKAQRVHKDFFDKLEKENKDKK